MARLVIGLDISGDNWKSVVISTGLKEKLRVEGYASFPPLPFAASEFFSSAHEDETVTEALEEWSRTVHEALAPFLPEARGVVIGTPGEGISLRVLELPFLQPAKLRSVLPFEVESSLPFDAEDLVFDYYPLRQSEGKTRLLTAAAPRDQVEAALAHLKLFMVDPVILGPTPLALHHLVGVATLPAEAGAERLLFLNLGERFTHLVAVDAGRTVFSTRLRGGKDALVEGGPAAEALLAGLRRTLHFLEGYAPLDSGCPPSLRRLVLVGDGASLPGIERAVEDGLGVSASRFVFPEESMLAEARIPAELQPAFGPALALALEYTAPNGKPVVNFRRGQFAYRPEQALIVRKGIFPGILAAILLLALGLNYHFSGASDQSKAAAIRSEMLAEFQAVFPGKPVSDPKDQISALLKSYKEKQKSYEELDYPGPLEVLAEVSKAVPPEIKVTISSLEYKGKDVSINGETEKLDDTNEIEKRLASVPMFFKVKLDKANSVKEGATWRFKINFDLRKVHGK
jgi:general secretion pathway protein L